MNAIVAINLLILSVGAPTYLAIKLDKVLKETAKNQEQKMIDDSIPTT